MRELDNQVNPGACQRNYTTKRRDGEMSGWENNMCGILQSALISSASYTGSVINLTQNNVGSIINKKGMHFKSHRIGRWFDTASSK